MHMFKQTNTERVKVLCLFLESIMAKIGQFKRVEKNKYKVHFPFVEKHCKVQMFLYLMMDKKNQQNRGIIKQLFFVLKLKLKC